VPVRVTKQGGAAIKMVAPSELLKRALCAPIFYLAWKGRCSMRRKQHAKT